MSDPILELFAEDRQKIKESEAENAWRERMLLRAMDSVMDTEEGKTLMWWLLEQTHYFQGSMTGNSWTFFREGERNIGSKLLEKMFTVRPQVMQELIEHRNKQQENPDD